MFHCVNLLQVVKEVGQVLLFVSLCLFATSGEGGRTGFAVCFTVVICHKFTL